MVKFQTTFNSESTKSVNKMQMKKLSWVYIICSLVFLLLGVMEIFTYITTPEEGSLGFAIFWIAFGVLFYPLCRLLTFFLQKKIDKSMPILSDDTLETYEFFEDKLIIETHCGQIYNSKVEASYRYIFKIVENEQSYFLYISKAQCHVVMKKFLTEGSLEELHGYFKRNFICVPSGSTITYKR